MNPLDKPRRIAADAPPSLLGFGLGKRLTLAVGLLALLWLAVGWGLR